MNVINILSLYNKIRVNMFVYAIKLFLTIFKKYCVNNITKIEINKMYHLTRPIVKLSGCCSYVCTCNPHHFTTEYGKKSICPFYFQQLLKCEFMFIIYFIAGTPKKKTPDAGKKKKDKLSPDKVRIILCLVCCTAIHFFQSTIAYETL